jgi:hypothetical protein
MILRHCERSEAIHKPPPPPFDDLGLLRCARHDGCLTAFAMTAAFPAFAMTGLAALAMTGAPRT